ncbi:MAG: PSD1 and planctomycete cytochrome C domain-containing protein [Planctomycetota bacterium]|nr:PSD1 and planctomycete cytochrome C domain-containing protein [Planctomycetota bacterium]
MHGILVTTVLLLPGVVEADTSSRQGPISFARHVRPILSEHCFKCHGMDSNARKAGLRFDTPEGLLGQDPQVVIPGEADASLLMQRITHPDLADRMPPVDAGEALTSAEQAIIRQWINEGASWEAHWAFVQPQRIDPPEVAGVSHPIDAFIRDRLDKETLEPSPPATPATRLRRLTLDLTGLPATPAEQDAFLQDNSVQEWEANIDRLLASPRYGEHQGRYWLDAARYADTHGYHLDNERTMWKYRDWVIDAFNGNMPFDQFTVEQLAGDLLEDTTVDQRVASGFNRCHSTTSEGGAIKAEYLVKYVVDRVEATSTIWMGLTTGCAACHDHKFDPISQKEFYELFAFFNSTTEEVMDGNAKEHPPVLAVPDLEQASIIEGINARRAEAQGVLDTPDVMALEAMAIDIAHESEEERRRWYVATPMSITTASDSTFARQDDGSYIVSGPPPGDDIYEVVIPLGSEPVHAIRLEAMRDTQLPGGGPGRNPDNGNIVLSEFQVDAFPATTGLLGPEESARVTLARATADHSQPNYDISTTIDGKFGEVNGWAILKGGKPGDRMAIFQLEQPIEFEDGAVLRIRLHFVSKWKNHSIGRLRLAFSSDPKDAPTRADDWEYAGAFTAESVEALHTARFQPEEESLEAQPSWSLKPEYVDGKVHAFEQEAPAAHYVRRTIHAPTERTLTVSLGSDDGLDVILNGNRVHENNTPRGAAPDQDTVDLLLDAGANELMLRIDNYGGACGFYYRPIQEGSGSMTPEMSRLLAMDPASRTEEQQEKLKHNWLRTKWPPGQEAAGRLEAADKELAKVNATVPTTYVSKEMDTPRTAHILIRGQYDQPGEEVTAGTPSILPPMAEDAPRNRLGFARWLVHEDHPLTARVTVNRIWQQYFGQGLVITSEDFGIQGDQPSHPELLDWLATWFVNQGWDMKALHRLIVTSDTYQQSSRMTPTLQEVDPGNSLLARFPRHRLDAEIVRDQALAVSGLLVEQQGGPSVKPYQPDGLWMAVGYSRSNTVQFERDDGDALWRRSLYTFWKRTSPPPAMTLMDAPSREYCTVRRERTNTPLAALLLLNDVQFVEAARALGQRVMVEGGASDEDRASWAFRLVTGRTPSLEEQALLLSLYEEQRAAFQEDPAAATELLSVGTAPRNEDLDQASHAAWSMVANLILNLDETISKG